MDFPDSSPANTEPPGSPGLATFFQQEARSPLSVANAANAANASASSGLDGFFKQEASTKRAPAKPAAGLTVGGINTGAIDVVAQREGLSATQKQVMGALLGQESNYGKNPATSIDGARGAGQVMPDTFRRYAKAGELIDNPADNLAVMARIVRDLGTQSGDDPARMAVGYFSGSGNINHGSGTAWRKDKTDGNGKSVSSYASDVLARMNVAPATTAAPAPDDASAAKPTSAPPDPLANAPKWASVLAKPEYQAMSASDKAGARQAYFQQFIEPGIAPAQRGYYRTWFEGEANKAELAAQPSLFQSLKTTAGKAATVLADVFLPEKTNTEGVLSGLPQTDPYAGDRYDASVVGFANASKARRAKDAELAALRAYIDAPPTPQMVATEPKFTLKQQLDPINNLSAATLGVGKGFSTLGKYASLLLASPTIARDKLAGDNAASGMMFDNVVKPFDDAMAFYEKNNGQLPQTMGNTVSNGLGDLAATMPAIIATGGGVNPGTKYMTDIAKYAFAQGMRREAVMTLVKGSADTLGNAIVTMSPAAIPAGFERYQKLLHEGVAPGTAAQAAFAEYATTTAMGAIPLWKAGNIETRIATGELGGIGLAAGSTALQNKVLEDYPRLHQNPFDSANIISGGITGGVLAGVMGHQQEGKVTVTRTGQKNLATPPRQEPVFDGTTIDGATGRPEGEPDPHAPRLGERMEPKPYEQAAPETAQPASVPEPAPDVAHPTPPEPAPKPQRTVSDRNILDYADTRYRQLRNAHEGETRESVDEDGQITSTDQPGSGMTAGEAAELAMLQQHRGDVATLAHLYGFNQPGKPKKPPLALAAPAAPAEDVQDPQSIANPKPATHADLIEQRDQAIQAYRAAAVSGDEIAAQAAEQQLEATREQINAVHLDTAKALHEKQVQADQAAQEAKTAATPPPPAAPPQIAPPKTEKEAKARREAAAKATEPATESAVEPAAKAATPPPPTLPRTEKQAQLFRNKLIPDMSDAELVQAKAFYPADHKRAPKIVREIARRADEAANRGAAPYAPLATTQAIPTAPPPAAIPRPPLGKADSLQIGDHVAFTGQVGNDFYHKDEAKVIATRADAVELRKLGSHSDSIWIARSVLNGFNSHAWFVRDAASAAIADSKPILYAELRERLSALGERALAIMEGKLEGTMMGFTVGMRPNDSNLTRQWVDHVVQGFENTVSRLEKRAAKNKAPESSAKPAQPAELAHTEAQPTTGAPNDNPQRRNPHPRPDPVANPASEPPAAAGNERTDVDLAGRLAQEVQATRPAKPDATEIDSPAPATGASERTAQRPEPDPHYPERKIPDGGTAPEAVAAKPHHFTLTDELNFSGQGAKTRYKNNIAAIHVLQELETAKRRATHAEQSVLARYIGWGGLPQAFNPKDTKWAKEFAELQSLLTPAQYSTAASSTRNAHYTAAPVVKAIWAAVQRMGFTHGAVLEPSLGTGNFFGLMPQAGRSKSKLFGVEFDHTTGSIAKHLYPQAHIKAPLGFQDFAITPGSFDLAIGNPPFGAEQLYDKTYPELSKFKIHGYFFAKSVEALRPGGILAMVVSKGLLDANDAQGKAARNWLAAQTRLIGAIRLPNTAFTENANTEVTTDIVFLQKLGNGIKPNANEWTSLGELTDRETSQPIAINQYFVAHPEMMLGEMTLAGSMYRANEATLAARTGDDLSALLAAAIQSLPADIVKTGSSHFIEAQQKINHEIIEQGSAQNGNTAGLDTARLYAHYLQDGKLYQRMHDVNGERQAVPVTLAGRELERMAGMIGLRDLVRRQLALEQDASASESVVDSNRAALSQAYDRFKAANGLLNRQSNKRLFRDDSDAALLLSLEAKYDKGVSQAVAKASGQKPREARAIKATIFTKRVQNPVTSVTRVASAKEAMIASLNERGHIDPAFMEKVYGKSMEQSAQELGDLVFEDPLTSWQPHDLYLSGNVKAALQAARAAAMTDARFERNVSALLKVQPTDIKPSDIFVKIGSPWVAASDYHDFVKQMFGGSMTGTFLPSIGRWSVAVNKGTQTETHSKYGTDRMGAHSIVDALMTNKQVAVYDYRSDGKGGSVAVLNVDATAAAQGKADDLADAFQQWIWDDNDRRARLAREYNDKFNTNVARKYDGSHLTLPGQNPTLVLRPHQLNWVYRALVDGIGLADHVVGAGKTFALIATAMEMRRLGLAKKPIITVPNHLVGQWANDILNLYPGANVLAASRKDFVKDRRKLMFSKIATGDWDMVIVAHSSFGRIPVPIETENAILEEQMREIIDAIKEAKQDKGAKFTVKDLERTKVRVEERMKKLADRPQDDLLSFADLGVDALFVDEAHEFKNLFFSTALQNVAGLGSPTGSSRAFDMFVKTRYVLGRTAGRNVFFATGTPLANSIAEVFHMQRFLQNDTLRERGIHQFDAWANTFGQATADWEMNAAGKFVQKTRFRKFANLPELKGIWNEVADTVTRADLISDAKKQGQRFPLPKIATGKAQNIVSERSQQQADFIGVPQSVLDEKGKQKHDEVTGQPLVQFLPGTIVYRLDNWKEASKNNPKEIPLAITGAARKAGLDFRLIEPSAPDFAGSKVNAAVDRIFSTWQANDHRAGTQLVFCDLSVPSKHKGRATTEAAAKVPTFFIRDGETIEHVAGVALNLVAAPDAVFFSFTQGKRVAIYERTSGLSIASGTTRQAAIDTANSGIASIGQDRFNQRIANKAIPTEQLDEYRARWDEAQQAKEDAKAEKGDSADNADSAENPESSQEISLDELLADSGGSFSVYDDIRSKLIAKGMPEDQIAFIHDYDTDDKKAALFNAMNAGTMRVLIGSTQKMGAGTNVQAKLVALHHMDAPWRPADLEQREGRIIRQGNEFYAADPDGFEVSIYRYATKQTYDSRMWEIIETKARAIEQFKLDASLREIDDVSSESANAAEMKAGASGNPLILKEIGLRTDLRKLDAQKKSWDKSRYDLQIKITDVTNQNGWVYDRQRTATRLARQIEAKEGAELHLNGRKVRDIKKLDAAKVFTAFMTAGAENAGQGAVVGHYRGFFIKALDIGGHSLGLTMAFEGEVVGRTSYDADDKFSISGFMIRLDNAVDSMSRMVSTANQAVKTFEADAELAKVELQRDFPKAQEWEDKKDEHKAVVAALRAGKTEVAAEPDGVIYHDVLTAKYRKKLIATVEAGPLAQGDEPKRAYTLGKLKALRRKLDAKKLTESEYLLGISEVVNLIQKRNDARTPCERETGPDWLEERLIRAKRQGDLDEATVNFALWAIRKNPVIANHLGISLKTPKGNAAIVGNYNSGLAMMTLFKNTGNVGTVVHEIMHHTERMMPQAVQRGIVREWRRAWADAWKHGDPALRAALDDMLTASTGDKKAFGRVVDAFKTGVLVYDRHYQLSNASEFWAVNATRILSGRHAAQGAWVATAKQWLGELLHNVKGWLGLRSDAPVLTGMHAVMNGDGERMANNMLGELHAGENRTLHDLSNPRRVTEQSQKDLIEEFGKPIYSNMDWWDKSVGTQFHKAEKHPHFRKAFNLALARENAVSLTAIRPAELAPAFLPRLDDFKSAVSTLIKGKNKSQQMGLAGDAILSGTLYGESVLDGKVWTDDELQSKFGMDQHGIALYRQARAAIDASLDEVAAAEAFAALQMLVPRGLREKVIDDPANSFDIMKEAIDLQIDLDKMRLEKLMEDEAQREDIEKAQAHLADAIEARRKLEEIFAHTANLKQAGYAPLMRFGKNFVSVEQVDPATGRIALDKITKKPIVLYFGRFETNGEAEADYFRQQANYRGNDEVRVQSGPINDERHRLYQGVSAETIALFGEVVGDANATNHFYQAVLSERSALKRRLERKNISGFSQDMPRILSNAITSNGRFAAQRYYNRDLMTSIKRIPRAKGDVQKEAQRLKEFMDNPQEGGAIASSLAFVWFLGGNIASAAVNATQPVMMTLPYLSQWGAAKAATALTKAVPQAMGKQQITHTQLRIDLKRAGQEGKVDAQEIFHLYSVGIQGVAATLTNQLGRLPVLGSKVKLASEDARARLMAFSTLWGMPFAMVEGFNRRLTFIAAWNMATDANLPDPYGFAVKAVDATQGIYNKVNRPNWARSTPGRILFTFTQFRVMNVELLKRMATMGGAEGKRGAAMYLAILILAAGAAGLPYADDIDDLIDTAGQWLGYGTNMKRTKREWAYKTLGKGFGDLALYGVSSKLPFDFGGRLGLGNMFPATGMGKLSNEGNRTREFLELGGPAIGGLGQQVLDAYDAASMGDTGKAAGALMPSSIKNAAAGLDMASTGKALDMKGKLKADVSITDAISKGIGFNPTVLAAKNRANLPIQQDIALQKVVESNIVELWAQGAAKGDQDMMNRAKAKMEDWNQKNPDMPVMISTSQIMGKARQILTPTDDRLLKNAPREMRGRVAAGLDQSR